MVLVLLEPSFKEDSQVMFKFFSKPMKNNLLIQFGTCLSRNVIFSSLRQDLIRRMLNCSVQLPMDERIAITNEYIQLMSNSGQSFSITKVVVLQA